MEENYQENNNHHEERKHICFENHCWKKCLAMVLAAFLGGFLAFYFVMDQLIERMHNQRFNHHKIEKRMFDDMDRMYKRDMKAFDDAFKREKKIVEKMNHPSVSMPAFMFDSVKIKTEIENNKYKIIIDLKPFQGDENKINYNVIGRKMTVYGSSDVVDRDFEHTVSFSQDFILPNNADITNISKLKDGHKLIILIPLK